MITALAVVVGWILLSFLLALVFGTVIRAGMEKSQECHRVHTSVSKDLKCFYGAGVQSYGFSKTLPRISDALCTEARNLSDQTIPLLIKQSCSSGRTTPTHSCYLSLSPNDVVRSLVSASIRENQSNEDKWVAAGCPALPKLDCGYKSS